MTDSVDQKFVKVRESSNGENPFKFFLYFGFVFENGAHIQNGIEFASYILMWWYDVPSIDDGTLKRVK